MINLESFNADLTFEQDPNSISGVSGEGYSGQTSIEETRQGDNNLKNRQEGLGHVFLVLFQAKRSTVKKALSDLSKESPISNALSSLISHVTSGHQGNDESRMFCMQQIYNPLLDKVLKKSDDSGRKMALSLLDWLILTHPHKSLMERAICLELKTGNKKRKLAIIIAIEHALKTVHMTLPIAQEDINQSEEFVSMYPQPQILLNWISLLRDIACDESTVVGSGGQVLTQLISKALELSVEISYVIADQTICEIQKSSVAKKPVLVVDLAAEKDVKEFTQSSCCWCLIQCMKAISQILGNYKSCVYSRNCLESEITEDILDQVKQFNTSQSCINEYVPRYSLMSFAISWKVISQTFNQRYTPLSIDAAKVEALKYLKQDLSLTTRFLAACISLGRCVPLTQIREAIQNSEDIKSELFISSCALITEKYARSVRSAFLVQQIYTELVDSHDLEQVRCHMFLHLDLYSHISEDLAKVLAQYIMIFPSPLLQELLKNIPESGSSVVKKSLDEIVLITNIYTILIELSKSEFFDIILPQDAKDLRFDENVKKPKTPAQLVRNAKALSCRVVEHESCDYLFQVFKVLGESIGNNQWDGIVHHLVLKTYGSPMDENLVKIWNSLAVAIGNSPEAIKLVSISIIDLVDTQGPATEEMLEDAIEASDESIDDLRFSRLSPILMLKTIPAQAFSLVLKKAYLRELSTQMQSMLESKCTNQLEFGAIRALSKSIVVEMF
ncbi:hypothetical protein BGZ76_003036 [Entomortierella beljakovae]|nr:hypothetical protein BGZ76_003036 [Entomortierella beljakovae]